MLPLDTYINYLLQFIPLIKTRTTITQKTSFKKPVFSVYSIKIEKRLSIATDKLGKCVFTSDFCAMKMRLKNHGSLY